MNLSVLQMASLGSSLSVRSMVRFGSSLSVLAFVHLGSSLSLRSMARLGSSLSMLGTLRLGSSLSVMDLANLGSSLSLRSYARLGSALSVLDFVHLGSSLSVRSNFRVGGDLHTHGKLYFNTNTYMYDNSNTLETVVGGNKAMSMTNSGGTLHGMWYADTVISVSDRRLKDKITPLETTVGENRKLRQKASAQREKDDASESSLSWVLRQLRPVSYNFKRGIDAKNMRFGFIADEVEQVLPQIVRQLPGGGGTGSTDGSFESSPKKGIVYPDLIAVLTAMMREFGTQLKATQARVKAAEMELDRLDQEDPMEDEEEEEER